MLLTLENHPSSKNWDINPAGVSGAQLDGGMDPLVENLPVDVQTETDNPGITLRCLPPLTQGLCRVRTKIQLPASAGTSTRHGFGIC